MPNRQGKKNGRPSQRKGTSETRRPEERIAAEVLYKCEICGAEFSDIDMLDRHKRIHDREPRIFDNNTPGIIEVPVIVGP